MTDQQWLPPAQPEPVASTDWGTGQTMPPPPPPLPVAYAPQPAWTPAPPPPAAYAAYCRGCGTAINPHAAMCVRCGVPNGAYGVAPLAPSMPKQKSTGIVLAVLFGLFGWLYTYKRDAWKFWLNLAMAVLTIGIWGLVAWIWAVIDMSVKSSAWYESFPNG